MTDIPLSLLDRHVAHGRYPLSFHAAEYTLHRRVVVAITPAAHALAYAVSPKPLAKLSAPVLDALVGMKQQALRLAALLISHVQRLESITFNVTGAGARINSNSTDNSTNTINTGSQVMNHLDTIRKELAAANLSDEQAAEAADVLEAVEVQLASGKPKKGIVKVLLGALPSVASISTAIASILAGI